MICKTTGLSNPLTPSSTVPTVLGAGNTCVPVPNRSPLVGLCLKPRHQLSTSVHCYGCTPVVSGVGPDRSRRVVFCLRCYKSLFPSGVVVRVKESTMLRVVRCFRTGLFGGPVVVRVTPRFISSIEVRHT